ncbi:hypothetical protein N7456_002954 [Penicillium angulare]|uniref:Uncharacterized protein n=1 Tax=Penicillium angulare TaxID=116970 RepID=A0A9W9FTX8_9EURO|nr:hypothetical protein N7456_002954 [Penicillium angulare]
MSIRFIDSSPSPESGEERPDLWRMFKLEMERNPRPVTKGNTGEPPTRSATRPPPRIPLYRRSPQNQDLEILLNAVSGHTIGFEISSFSELVTKWIPRLEENLLPGSYQHLLALMLADSMYCTRMHRAMAGPGAIPDFLSSHRDNIQQLERASNIDRPLKLGKEPSRTARLAPHPDYTAEGRSIDEGLFESDLSTLRELVGPLRDPNQLVLWITGRSKKAKKMLEQWEESMKRIKQFREELLESQNSRKTNWTIYHTANPRTEEREDLMSMRQSRIDACKATMMWGEYLPDESQLWESNKYAREIHMKRFHRRSYSENSLNVSHVPKHKITENMDQDIRTTTPPQTPQESSILNFLVQIAEWLALARGFPAVHLFIDMVRLFTSYGVDVANATQVQYCRFIPRMRLSAFADRPIKHRTKSLLTFQEKTGVGNKQYFADVKGHNQYLMDMLLKRDTLLSFDNESISWKQPLQTLKWADGGGFYKALNLKGSCPRHRFGSWNVSDEAWQDNTESDRLATAYGEGFTEDDNDDNDQLEGDLEHDLEGVHQVELKKKRDNSGIIDSNEHTGRGSSALLDFNILAALLDTMDDEEWKHRIRKGDFQSE